MGLDATIRSKNGINLGNIVEVQARLSAILPGIRFYTIQSGAERIRLAKVRGIVFPESIHDNIVRQQSEYRAEYDGDGLKIEFGLGNDDEVELISLSLYGKTVGYGNVESKLESINWITSFP